MLPEATTSGIIYSAILGGVIGLLIGVVWKRPRRWSTFGIMLFFSLISPWVGVSTYLVHSGDLIIPFRPFFAALMGLPVLFFLVRMILKSQRAEMQPE